MKWKDVEPYAVDIVVNLAEKKRLLEKISNLQDDLGVDIYLDEQPGGGNCVSTNLGKQKQYEQLLDKLYDVTNLIPDIEESDIPTLDNLMERLLDEYNFFPIVENQELTDKITQGFEFAKHCSVFSEKEITDETINTFFAAGKYISEQYISDKMVASARRRYPDIPAKTQ
jgi:hypothetical protein